jgi:hypothetical protein
VTAQQLGSGMKGLGIGVFTLDWATVSAYLMSPLVTPFFATVNILFGYVLVMYVVIPTAYWGFNLHNAKTFPIFSSRLFMSNGTEMSEPSSTISLSLTWMHTTSSVESTSAHSLHFLMGSTLPPSLPSSHTLASFMESMASQLCARIEKHTVIAYIGLQTEMGYIIAQGNLLPLQSIAEGGA